MAPGRKPHVRPIRPRLSCAGRGPGLSHTTISHAAASHVLEPRPVLSTHLQLPGSRCPCIPRRRRLYAWSAVISLLSCLPKSLLQNCLRRHNLQFTISRSVMASLEPPIPANVARVVEMPLVTGDLAEEQGFTDWEGKAGDCVKWRRIVGLLLLFLTVFLWTVSNFLASVRRPIMLLAYLGLTDFDVHRRSSQITRSANPTLSHT